MSVTDALGARMRPSDTAFIGHPRGLAYLIAVEGFWAFAYFGLQAWLTLYMTKALLLPGHEHRIWGFELYRRLLEGGGGPISPVELASQTYGLLTGLSYALPLVGALVADRWLGQKRTVTLGLVVLAAAQVLLISERGFLLGLGMLILGAGFLKCNLMVQIGRLYAPNDPRRTSAFAFYLICANIGSFTSPLIAGTLAEKVSFHAGLIALAVGMSLALVSYLMGRNHLPPDVMLVRGEKLPPLSGRDRKVALVLVAMLLPEILYFGAYQQTFNIFPIWASDHVNLDVAGFRMPVTWFSTLDGLLTIAGAMVAIRLWDWQARRNRAMGDMTRLGVGSALGIVAFLILAGAALAAGQGKAPLLAGVGYLLFADPAITWIDTVTMSLMSRAAPAQINTTMMGVYTLATSAAYFMTGATGRLYEHMTPAAFWGIHAGICGVSLLFLLVCGRPIAKALATP